MHFFGLFKRDNKRVVLMTIPPIEGLHYGDVFPHRMPESGSNFRRTEPAKESKQPEPVTAKQPV